MSEDFDNLKLLSQKERKRLDLLVSIEKEYL